MSPRKPDPNSARARAGQALAALGLDRDARKAWLDAHAHLGPRELLKALTDELMGGDSNLWRNLPDGSISNKGGNEK